ncbi:hypothetical protein GON26_17550 [Flavobacterium sp. GA093]|uniref:DUF4369 domain-containing protein n=1 Tax=Flavobacterium hydrocarbonoxydans TaxID=2683249 RepID=A0A6I4NQ14_9FLAO|nr:hypothetical protein [Flavobacterium hydrocarbonoxydans]MWB96171.1 hypothetical protein [Flavobacterium hydrocarbonoxydans]
MKKTITYCLLLFFSLTVNAQEFTDVEYVASINKIIQNNQVTFVINSESGKLDKISYNEGQIFYNSEPEGSLSYFNLIEISAYQIKDNSLILIDEEYDKEVFKFTGISKTDASKIILELRNLYLPYIKKLNKFKNENGLFQGTSDLKAQQWTKL